MKTLLNICTLAALLAAAAVNAAPITIDNASFESPVTATFDFTVTSWFEENKTANDALESVQNEAANVNLPLTPFGVNWMNLTDAAAIYQEIDTFVANTEYTFSGLLIGDRSNKLFGALNVQLWVGNGTGANNTALSSFATLADSATFDITEVATPSTLAISDFTLSVGTSFTSGDSVWLRFSSTDGGGVANDSQVLFDNINVVSAIPEPASILLVGLAGIAGLALRRRAR